MYAEVVDGQLHHFHIYLFSDILDVGAGVAGKPQSRGAFLDNQQITTTRTEKIHDNNTANVSTYYAHAPMFTFTHGAACAVMAARLFLARARFADQSYRVSSLLKRHCSWRGSRNYHGFSQHAGRRQTRASSSRSSSSSSGPFVVTSLSLGSFFFSRGMRCCIY